MLNRKQLKLAACLWLAGMAGVVALTLTVLPQLLAMSPSPLPTPVAAAASMLQSAVLVALAVWAGVVLAPPLGLHAPVAEAAVAGTGIWQTLKPRVLPAAAVGLLVGGLLTVLTSHAPQGLRASGAVFEIPFVAKLLYGGVTEEILMRWGLMTALLWSLWRVLQKRAGPPRRSLVFMAIVVAALLFGVGHLPLVMGMGVELSGPVAMFIIAANAVPGILFGWLYWRWGLEAAMLAHAMSHATATVAALARSAA